MSKIEWTDVSWNPVRGCSRVSEGCRHCYAERMAMRFRGPGKPFENVVDEYGWTGKVELIEHKLEEPLHWKRPRTVFVNSMSDLFHEALPDEAIDRLFAVMALCPRHTFQVLTKRAERMYRYLSSNATVGRFFALVSEIVDGLGSVGAKHSDDGRNGLKLPNVWLGVSCEDQQTADERIPWLLQTPAAVRFLSLEPLLGQVDLGLLGTVPHSVPYALVHQYIHWVILGGESGPGARPCNVQWIRDVVRQCREAGVPCFVKQLTERGRRVPFKDWPSDLQVREMPHAV